MWVQDAVAWYTINRVPGNTLEIGTAFGGSAIIASKAKQDSGVDGLIYCVDPQDGTYGKDMVTPERATIEITTGNFDKFGVENVVIFQHRTPPLPSGLFGMMFTSVLIDGNHKGSGPTDDWNIVKDSVLPGGIVMFHDVHYDDVQRAVYLADKEPGWWPVTHYLVRGHGMPSQMQVAGNEKYGSYATIQKQ